jgi:mannose-6-phosphate isomerase-like protein (cupin superfamily)
VDSRDYYLIAPDDLSWRPSGIMRIPNADFLERTGTTLLGARLWRLPPKSANTLHKHIRSAEFYFVLEGVGRMRVGDDTLTVPRYGAVFVGPAPIRQVFNDTAADALWLIVGAPEEERMPHGPDDPAFYPRNARELPDVLEGVNWPPNSM